MSSILLAVRRRWPWALGAGLAVALLVWLPELRRPPALHRASAGLLVGDLKPFAARLPADISVDSPAALVASDAVGDLAASLMLAFPDGKGMEQDDDALLDARNKDADAADALRARIRAGWAEGKVTAAAGDGATAVRAANAWARAAAIVVRRLPGVSRELLDREIARIRERLEAADLQAGPAERRREEALRRLDALDDAEGALSARAEQLRAAQDRALARIKSIELLEHRLREALPAGQEENGISSPLLDRLRQERESIRAEIAIRKLERTPEAPEAVRLQGRLQDVVEEIRKELFHARDATVVKLRNSVDELDAERRALDERRLRISLDRREAQEELGARDPALEELLGLRSQLAAAEEAARKLDVAVGPVTLGEPAERADVSGGVRGAVVLGGLGAGLLAALGAALLAQSLDRRVRTATDVRRALGLPLVARVPVAAEPFLLRAPAEDPIARAFSIGAGVLRGYLEEREYRTVLVVGAVAGEGTTTCAVDLAVALARKGLSVALLDADLRGPRIAGLFGLDDYWGLASILRGDEPPAEFPAPAPDLPNLRVIPAGAAADIGPESLESGRFIEFLRVLREGHEVVVVDGPPLRDGGDAVTLAGLADTVIRVVRWGLWTDASLGWSRDVLRNLRADVAGAVLNLAPPADDPASLA
jgi:Mrp family chromosome partitioning ATPase